MGKGVDNIKGRGWGRRNTDKLVVYACNVGKKVGMCKWEATTAIRLNVDLIVFAQRVNKEDWEVTSPLS